MGHSASYDLDNGHLKDVPEFFKNNYADVELFVEHGLLVSDDMTQLIFEGNKRALIGYERGCLRVPADCVLQLYEQTSDGAQKLVGDADINRVIVKSFDMLDEKDAKDACAKDLEALTSDLKKTYGDIKPYELITIYHVRLQTGF